jgi:hypothetical protein
MEKYHPLELEELERAAQQEAQRAAQEAVQAAIGSAADAPARGAAQPAVPLPAEEGDHA